MPLKAVHFFAALAVPQEHGLVRGSGGERLPIGRKGRAGECWPPSGRAKSRRLRSCPHAASTCPSGENANESTGASKATRDWSNCPLRTSVRRITASSPAEAHNRPSAERATRRATL